MRATISDIREKGSIAMLTAYNASIASILDESGVDILLVGDSVGNTRLGYSTTLPVTLEESLSHTAAVSRSTSNALVVGDMPFLSFGSSIEESVKNAGRYLKEANAQAVKLETPIEGEITLDIIERLVELGIPVMGHTGLTPQSVHVMGGYKVQGREKKEELIETALELEESGVFSLVLESIPEVIAKEITEKLDIPTIGIGAGRYVDGQVLVIDDLLGLSDSTPKFVKQYTNLEKEIKQSTKNYIEDIQKDRFPEEKHVFDPHKKE